MDSDNVWGADMGEGEGSEMEKVKKLREWGTEQVICPDCQTPIISTGPRAEGERLGTGVQIFRD